DADAVLVLRPVVTLAGTAPSLEQVTFAIELHDRGRRATAFGGRRIERQRLLVVGKRPGALDHPDMILRVNGDARGLAHDPVVRQRLGPRGVDLEAGNIIGECRACEDGGQKQRKTQPHDILPALAVNGFMVRERSAPAWGPQAGDVTRSSRGLGPKQIIKSYCRASRSRYGLH